jgi:hypothetical protein
MKSITELTVELTDLYQALKDGTIDVKFASEMNNTAGKIINVQKVQLEYAALRDETPVIPFLSGTTAPKAPATKKAKDTK